MEFGHLELKGAYAFRRFSAVDQLDDVAAAVSEFLDVKLVVGVKNRDSRCELVKRGQWENSLAFRTPPGKPFLARSSLDHNDTITVRTFGTREVAPRLCRRIVPQTVGFRDRETRYVVFRLCKVI